MKKTTKRLFTMLLAVVLLFVNANFAFAIEFDSSGTDVEEPTFYNATSSTLDLSLYFDVEEFTAYLIEQMELLEGDTSTYATMSIRNFNIPRTDAIRLAITELIFYNTPELFRIKRLEFGYSGGYYTSIRCLCFYTRAEYVEMHADMLAVTEKLVKGIKDNPSLTDVEKALLLHDRLAMHCEYDYDTYLENKGILPQTSYNAYGALVLRDAVCMGYALAYDFLLEQVGIKSLYCSSDTINHAWNIVYINNIPYHVDVTWDDPVWDVYGQITHENFLLSTAALKATGHSASDFLSFPDDTTYENYYWKESESAFQLIDGEYYYYDNATKDICKKGELLAEDFTVVKTLPGDIWTASGGGYWPGDYTKFSGDGRYLYYNTKDKVYKYDPRTDTEEVVFEPDLTSLGDAFSIYGMMHYDCKIVCDVYNTPNFDKTVREKYTLSTDAHTPSEWTITKEPTSEEAGEKTKTCINCSTVLETDVLPTPLFLPLDNTETTIDKNVIFTSIDLCSDVEAFVALSDNYSYEINASFGNATTDFLGTGSTITIFENGEKITDYRIIVAGDLDGDSVCDVMDIMLAELCVTNNKTPSADECYAANGYASDSIDESSFQFVVNTALG